MRQCGLSRNDQLTEQDFSEMHDAGIGIMELSPQQNEAYDFLDFDRYTALSEKYAVRIRSFHLRFVPFETLDISAVDEEARAKAVTYQKNSMTLAAAAGIRLFVIHPSGEPIADGERRLRMEAAKRSLAALAEHAARLGATVAVEDLPRTCLGRSSDEILELIGVDERLRVCFDTNHLLGEDPCDFARKVGKKIVTTHVSDYDFVDERHWLPGEGRIDWVRLIDTLDEIGYDGPLVYELGLKATATISRPRDLNAFDFAENCVALEKRLKPTVIGKPLV